LRERTRGPTPFGGTGKKGKMQRTTVDQELKGSEGGDRIRGRGEVRRGENTPNYESLRGRIMDRENYEGEK